MKKTPGKATAGLLALVGTLACAVVQAQMPLTRHHSFSDAQKWSAVFDDPARDATQKPHEVIRALALDPAARVADIGSGTGYFSVRLAHVLPKGRVYAVDIEPEMVKFLAARAKRERLVNVQAIQGAPEDPLLPQKVDLVLMVDVLHHIEDRPRYLEKLRGYLAPGGRVAVIDFRANAPEGPPPEGRLKADRVKAEFRRAGYRIAAEHGFLPNQYFLVFQAAG